MAGRDRREDPGQYFPGGSTVPKTPTPSGNVEASWQDISGKPQVSDLPARFTEEMMRNKVNEIARALGGRALAVLLACAFFLPAFGGIDVRKANKGAVFNDEPIVTNVTADFTAEFAASTNYTDAATNAIRSVDGAARPLPKYLHLYDANDSYPAEAAEYYRQRGSGVPAASCSSVRAGGFLYRNFDYPFDDRAEFVVKMSAGPNRFASVGVAQVGTNLTEQMVTSGKPEYSNIYKWLPGATVDGINENGVVAEINVVDGPPQWRSGVPAALKIHPLAAVRWSLDNGTSAAMVASNLAARIAFPAGWTQNFHYMIADATSTYIVENGTAYQGGSGVSPLVMTNFRIYPTRDTTGAGQERYDALTNGANITSQWWTLTYTAAGYRASDLPGITGSELTQLFNYWGNNPRESHRGETFPSQPQPSTSTFTWWQSVHTSVYDITNKVLRICVQEQDDWYTFQVPNAGGVMVEHDPTVPPWSKRPSPPVTESSTHPGWAANADHADNATHANTAGNAEHANFATYAASAESATNAEYSVDAGHANTADYATDSGYAASAESANNASYAETAGEAGTAAYASEAGSASSADNATTADSATTAGHADSADYALDVDPSASGLSHLVPYTNATYDVDIGWQSYYTESGLFVGYNSGYGAWSHYGYDFIDGWNDDLGYSSIYYFPWSPNYRDTESQYKFATVSQIEDATNSLSGSYVPYTGAENDVDLNWHQLDGVDSLYANTVDAPTINAQYVNVSWSYIYEYQCAYDGGYRPFFNDYEPMASLNEVGVKPWAPDLNYDEYDLISYGGNIYRCIEREAPSPSTFDPSHWEIPYATVSQISAATNGLAQTIPQKINAAVSANLNTYIDGETGVEYVGKFYGGSLYYVPTGNVYPPNN